MNDFITNVTLLYVPFDNTYKNVIDFSSLTEQHDYFLSTVTVNLGSNFNYIRKDGYIQVEKPIDTLYNSNYLMYQNLKQSTKYFYAFITNLEYVNEDTTRIYFEIDVYQTFMFNFQFKTSFVEREHVIDDTIGLHTVPEGLEHGEYIMQSERGTFYADYYICFALTEDIINPSAYPNNTYNRVYSGLTYVLVKDGLNAGRLILKFDKEARAAGIYTIFLVPQDMFDPDTLVWQTSGDLEYSYVPTTQVSYVMPSIKSTKPKFLGTIQNSYTPRNNKLFCYPYRYLLVSNSNGLSSTYNYEDFDTDELTFVVRGAISPGCQIRAYPAGYLKGSYEEGLNCGKIPVCSWVNDPFVNWLTQEGVNTGLGLLGDAMSMATSVASPKGSTKGEVSGGLGALQTGYNSILSTVGEIYTHSLIPKQAHVNTNSSELVFSMGYAGFRLYDMSIKPEYAKIIDDFFDMYGYKINKLKVPNTTGRPNWNYVKTIGANIMGDIPQVYLDVLKSIFDNGVTIWHNPSTIYDYSQNNKPA